MAKFLLKNKKLSNSRSFQDLKIDTTLLGCLCKFRISVSSQMTIKAAKDGVSFYLYQLRIFHLAKRK